MGTIQIIVYLVIVLLALWVAAKLSGKAMSGVKLLGNIGSGIKSEFKKAYGSVKTQIGKVFGKPGKKTKNWIVGIIIVGVGIWLLWPRIQSFRHPQKAAFSGQQYDTTLVIKPHSKLSRTVPPNYGITVDAPVGVITSNNKGQSYVTGANHIGSIITIENKNNREESVRLLYKPM